MVRPFLKTGRRLVYKWYYRSKSKTKAVLRVSRTTGELQRRWDSSTLVLWCENRHFILTATVDTKGVDEVFGKNCIGVGELFFR